MAHLAQHGHSRAGLQPAASPGEKRREGEGFVAHASGIPLALASTTMAPTVVRFALLGSLLASACGGVARDSLYQGEEGTGGSGANGGDPGDGATAGVGGKIHGGGGSGTGGKVGGTGGKVGNGAVTGAGGKVGGGGFVGTGGATGIAGTSGGCCAAAAVCNPGDVQVAGPFFCPPDTSCYQVSVCCSTIWCRRDPTCTLQGAPCQPGEAQIGNNTTCPKGGTCYQRAICGNVVTCFASSAQDAGASADAGCSGPPPRGVHYVSTSLQKCAVIDYACPAGTTGYGDSCGCGCQQNSNCPDYVNCQPGPGPTSALCADNSICPYSIRAL
jgi:hypothetical protein